ncbi:MAG: hypothetical protein JSV65_05120 [Armatimonadota bacterium]|nr:MAG: hypothetical protein JSV65_05120 [Armatimonadota bacterium]
MLHCGKMALAAALLVTLGAAALRCDTVHHDCGPVRLGFDGASGAWVGLWRAGSAVNLLSPDGRTSEVEIAAEEGPSFPGEGRRLIAHRVVAGRDSWRCEVESEDGPWRVTCSYDVSADPVTIRRRVSARWLGEQSVKVTGFVLRAPCVGLGGDPSNFYLVPGNFPVQRRHFRDLREGRREREEGVWTWTALALVHSPRHELAIAAGYELEVDAARVTVEEGDGAVSIEHRFSTLARLEQGDSLDCGGQRLLIAPGRWPAALRGVRRLADSLNNGPPADRPAWLDRGAIYSCHPGGSIDTGFRGTGGLANLEQRLPYLAHLGFSALWLNPITSPAPWVYSVSDYRAVADELGTKQDLRRFVERAHGLGLKVLLDLVPHGPNEDTPAAREVSADAWTYDEEGKLVQAWGGLAGDYASRAWRDYMTDVAAYWVREFGVDGYRVDCASGNAPNWKRGDGRRPSASSPLGGLELLESVRARIRPLNSDAALFPEAWTPVFFRAGDLVYDYPFYQVMRQLVTYASTEEWIRDARAWLQMERLTYPSGALHGLVRFTENHDTVRSDEFFGVGPGQALTALCVLAQGTPMIYQDQEIGYGARLRDWLDLRQAHAELRIGTADYEAVHCSHPGIMAFLRSAESGAAVVAINLSPRNVEATLEWPRGVSQRFPLAYHGGSGELLASGRPPVRISIPPYQPVVVLLRARRIQASPRGETSDPAAESLLLTEEAVPAGDGTTEYRLRVARARWWFVNTSEGLLLDRFVDRHTAEPITRYERLWRPLEAGLWDGLGDSAIGVIAADGRGLIVSDLGLDALADVRLEDDKHRGDAVRIAIRARGAERRFRVREIEDGWAAVQSLDAYSRHLGEFASIDPLRVTLENDHYRVVLSRRRGGLLTHLALAGGGERVDVPIVGSDVYTDWGLYDSGVYVSANVEPTPRLEVARAGGAVEVTFRGVLRTPSWNAVQRGYPAQPVTRYRITYRIDKSPVLRVTFGLTPETDRSDVTAFFAYLMQFANVESWFAETEQGRLAGEPGPRPGERVFETARVALASRNGTMGMRVGGREVFIRPIETGGLPQNVFFLDQGPERLALFAAMLSGDAVELPAGVERAVSLDFVLGD